MNISRNLCAEKPAMTRHLAPGFSCKSTKTKNIGSLCACNIMDSLPQDCQELIAQLAAQSTSGGVSVLTLMALAGVSRSWRTVVAQIDVRDAELQFCTSDDATVGQRKGRSTSAEAGLEAAYKAASETGKARLLESAVSLLRHYRCATLGAATDAVLGQVPSHPVHRCRSYIVSATVACGPFA